MNIRPLVLASRLFGLCALLCCFLYTPSAHAVTQTTIFSENFSSGTFPPVTPGFGTWTTGGNNNYIYYPAGVYYSPYGLNGANGSIWFGCYYNSPYTYGYNYSLTLQTPPINASAYATSADSVFLDFDLFIPADYYTYNYGSYYTYLMNISVGGTQLKSLSDYSNYSTYLNMYNSIAPSAAYDPYGYGNMSSYTSSSYWAHYHLPIAKSLVTSSMQVLFQAAANITNYGYYAENMALDNVVITDNHYTSASITPTSLGFGSLGVGLQSAAQSVLITNPNTTPLTVSGVAIAGTNPNDFQIVSAPTTIPANSTASISVKFTPTAKNFRQATLVFTTNADIGGSFSVTLTGTGLVPLITLSPQPLYPFRGTKTRFRTTITSSIIVGNTGGTPLVISPTTYIGGTYPGEYSIVRIPTNPISAGQFDTIIIAYSPTMEGAHYATLYINSNADNGQQVVTLYGIGILPRLMITPSELNFDSVALGTTQCDSLLLHNVGSDTIALTHNFFSSADGDFHLASLTGTDTLIPPDGLKYVQICFTPQRSGIRQARYRVTTNIPLTFDSPSRDTSSFFVNVIGEGVPYGLLAVRGTPVVDSEIVGQQLCTTDTLYNNGSADLVITSLSLTGPNSGEYKLGTVALPITIHPNGSYVFNICITPTARGDRNAMLNVTSTTAGKTSNSQLVLDVFGQTVCASVGSQTTAFPATTCVGSTDTAWVTISNCGDVTTIYNGAVDANATQYSIVGSAATAPISAGGTAKYGVVFKPTARGAAAGTITITGTGGINQVVTLNGVGGAASITGNGVAPLTQVGTTNSFTATVTNAGECDWTPGTPTITGANAGDFTATGGTTTIIPAGATGTITFSYHPTAVGTSNATATFPSASEASLPNPAAVTLSGTAQTEGVARLTEAQGFVLGQNYPNPFNPTTEIRFTLPEDSHVKLDIVDMTGRVVRTVLDGRMSAGDHGTVVNAAELSSGVYYYQLTAGNIKLTRQMILTK